MPTGLREIESSFKQVQQEYQNYAQRRQLLAIEVAAQESSLKRFKTAIREERQAISTERQLLNQEQEAFEVFRQEVLKDLQTQCVQLQLEQEKLKRDQQCTGYANLGNMVQHTCHKGHYQNLADSSRIPAQLHVFRSEQAQLIADLQRRLDHLAGVIASYDDERENQLHTLQQKVQHDAEALCELTKHRIGLQPERNSLWHRTVPLADVTPPINSLEVLQTCLPH